MKIHSRYDPPASAGITFTEPTRTQQHFRDECDINKVVERALRTGDATLFTTTQRAEYYDCTAFESYQASIDYVRDVEDDFDSLPSKTRKFFGNSVENYVSFMSDPRNAAQAVKLGLLEGDGEAATKPKASESPKASPAPAASGEPQANKSGPQTAPGGPGTVTT